MKAIVTKVKPSAVPPGVDYAWEKIPALEIFTKNIIIPEIAIDKDGNASVDISSIVSGMPTAFARANLFKNAIDNVTDKDAEIAGLLLFYKSLINEWKGFISCIALNYKDITIDRIDLAYSDGKSLAETINLYEPTGAFGNVLFERSPLWCDQRLSNNADKIPFIDVLSFKGTVVGGTSPDSFLFTSVGYKILEKHPFINAKNGKFIDPLQSDLKYEELTIIYGYVQHLLNQIERFRINFSNLEDILKPDYSNIVGCLQNWLSDMEKYRLERAFPKIDNPTPPEIGNKFAYPFSLLFNYSTELYGAEGVISYDSNFSGSIAFDPKDLLLPETAEIAQIDFGKAGTETKDYLKSKPILLLSAITKDYPNNYAYFTLPLTPLALNVFGANLTALVGLNETSSIRSRISAIYDPNNKEGESLSVTLRLFTQTGSEIIKQVVYKVTKDAIIGQDILIWPNFISKQWGRYFLYSEIPHNDAKFQATPFIGDVNDDFFRIVLDDANNPLYLSEKGSTSIIPEKYGNIKTQLHIASNNAVADNRYKYEIYESNQPFKGLRFAHAGKECGFGIIRYDGTGTDQNLPTNLLKNPVIDLAPAYLGIDFGSTNSSVAYFSGLKNEVCDKLTLVNRRISLLSSDAKNNDERPAVEDEIFFFQNDQIITNSIKSVLTLHDPRRLVNDKNLSNDSLVSQAVKGGFPCFEKNLPIDSATENRYSLGYNRVGKAELVYNMKWSAQSIDKSYKTAYLGSLLLHIYAQLFIEGHEPHTLKWSYPSSMGKGLLSQYRAIWDSLKSISPILSNTVLKTFPPSDLSDIPEESADLWGKPSSIDAWGTTSIESKSANWDTGSSLGGWDTSSTEFSTSNWGATNKMSRKPIDIKIDTDPIIFDFKALGNEESLTEACAVANYLVNSGYAVRPGELVLCFDIGGSTTDITVLCQMDGGKAMIKQNSIRFAAQRVANATKFSPNFKTVLLKICEKKSISIQGLNIGENKYNANTAPYYFEQVVDRLESTDFDDFYLLIAAECQEMMSVNLYVTGLIMYYAGQLAYKLRAEILRSEDVEPIVKTRLPKINIAFAGKGARIFDWFDAVNPKAANDYYTQMFIKGIGGEQIAKQTITPVNFPTQIININAQHKGKNVDVKYEVSKGLAIPTNITQILVPKNKSAIEILGEENFCVITSSGEMKYLNYSNSITAEMMENVGDYFICTPQQDSQPCPKFMEFAQIFFHVSSSMFNLKMTPDDFMKGFHDMNIESYIKRQPEFIEAQKRKTEEQKRFDFVAPIIILEGMKFYEDHLLKGIQKQS